MTEMKIFNEEDELQLQMILNVGTTYRQLRNELKDWCNFLLKAHGGRVKQDMQKCCESGIQCVYITSVHSAEIVSMFYKNEINGQQHSTMEALRVDPNISTVTTFGNFYPRCTVKELIDTGFALPILSTYFGSRMWVTCKTEFDKAKGSVYGIVDNENACVYNYVTQKLYLTFYPNGLDKDMDAHIEKSKNTLNFIYSNNYSIFSASLFSSSVVTSM
jgi:hypothetical protein